jgi:hypothetical protein
MENPMFFKFTLCTLVLVFCAGVARADNPTLGSAKSPTLGQGPAKVNANQQKTSSFELIVTDIKVSPINTAAGMTNNDQAASVQGKLDSVEKAMKKLDHDTTSAMVNGKLAEVKAIMKSNNDKLAAALQKQKIIEIRLKHLHDAQGGESVSDAQLKDMSQHVFHFKRHRDDDDTANKQFDLDVAWAIFDRLYDHGVDSTVNNKTLETLDRDGCPVWLLEFIAEKMRERDAAKRRANALWHTNTKHHGTNMIHQKDKIHIPIVGD